MKIMKNEIQKIQEEINNELANPAIVASLIETTFKGLSPENVRKAVTAGMFMGLTFKNFLQKDVYAIPFKDGFSLVFSIDYMRKIAQRSGIIGSPKQEWDMAENGKPLSCTVTVQKKVGNMIGDFSATVFFDEFNTGRNQWATKPKHMIGKVAETHALRKAFPEEMAQMYSEEEMQKEGEKPGTAAMGPETVLSFTDKFSTAKSIEEVKKLWDSIPAAGKTFLNDAKNAAKARLQPEIEPVPEESFDDKSISYDNI